MKNSIKKKNGSLRFAAVLCLVALWVAAPFALDNKAVQAENMSDIRIGATLSGAPINGITPAGFSEYRIDDQGRRRLRVEGNSINLAQGTVLQILVNNAVIGQTGVSQFGTIFFDIDSNNGQNVPVIQNGMPIQVRNGTTVVLTGTFGSVTPTPSPSGSPTGSPNPSPSGSPNPSPTGSPNPSPSATPTGSPNPSPSATPTGSPNPSPSATPTGSPNPSPSATPTGSPNPSPSATPTGSPNPSPSATPTGSPSPSPSGTPNAGGLFAALSGGTIGGVLPNGYAQFEIHSSRTELEVRLYQINLPAGTSLGVVVDNVVVGNLFLESGGEGRLRLRSDEGQTVPNIVAGSTIIIRNGGTTILSGVFTGMTGPSPSPSPSPTGTPGPSPSPTGSPNPSPSPSPTGTPALGRAFESDLVRAQSPANGEIRVTLNVSETMATFTGTFNNLGSNQTGARIESQVGSPIVLDLGVVGGTAGSFNTVTMAVTPAQVQQLRTGLWSAVITSAANPAGEIRGVVRIRSNPSDFDGDGSTDFAVFRPSDTAWYSQNSAGFSSQIFGGANDKIVSADYDGDGRTDAAVFRNVGGQGMWEVRRSSDGGTTIEQFGVATDIPVRGDYDGDGRGDLAVYRPSSGSWYVKHSNNTGYTMVQFGLSDDLPVHADMDGDGRDDIAVFRPSTGDWHWLRSSDGRYEAMHWGSTGDVPVRGDFDGDGKSDVTVFRPSTGTWYTYRSSDGGFQSAHFGLNGDVPVAGNFDGDAKTDVAVFRPADGYWYILRSSDGAFQGQRFGLSGDVPVNAR